MSTQAEAAITMNNSNRLWHPLLLGVYFILQLYAANADEFPFTVVFLPLLTVCSAIGISWLILIVPARGVLRAAVITSFAWGMFLFFFLVDNGLFGSVYQRISLFGREAELQDWLAIAWCGAIVTGSGVLLFLPRSKSRIVTINRALNIVFVCLTLAVLLTHAYSRTADWYRGGSNAVDIDSLTDQSISILDRDSLPNIVYMVLDGYGRDDTYRQLYHYDNTPFLDALRQRGFYIAEQARANYSKTSASVSATLNMNYHSSLFPDIPSTLKSQLPYFNVIRNNAVVSLLLRNDYTVRNFSSITFLADIGEGRSGTQFNRWRNREFEASLMNRTPLRAALKYYFLQVKNSDYDYQRERLLGGIDFIRESYRQESDSPLFVMSHVLFSHTPFVFGAKGEAINPDHLFTINDVSSHTDDNSQNNRQRSHDMAQVVDQVFFLNGELLNAIDDVLSNSNRPTVIILQGDHGPGSASDRSPEGLLARMPIFSAFYFPDRGYEMLAPDITPVNTFRVLLNKYLQANLPLLENRSFWVNDPYVFEFIDVTEQVPTRH